MSGVVLDPDQRKGTFITEDDVKQYEEDQWKARNTPAFQPSKHPEPECREHVCDEPPPVRAPPRKHHPRPTDDLVKYSFTKKIPTLCMFMFTLVIVFALFALTCTQLKDQEPSAGHGFPKHICGRLSTPVRVNYISPDNEEKSFECAWRVSSTALRMISSLGSVIAIVFGTYFVFKSYRGVFSLICIVELFLTGLFFYIMVRDSTDVRHASDDSCSQMKDFKEIHAKCEMLPYIAICLLDAAAVLFMLILFILSARLWYHRMGAQIV